MVSLFCNLESKCGVLDELLLLEEDAEVLHLEQGRAKDNDQLDDGEPRGAGVGALGGVAESGLTFLLVG